MNYPEPPMKGLWPVDTATYHRDRTCVSSSALSVFRRSVADYHAIYVAGTRPPEPATEAMNIGSALHIAVLEPWAFERQVTVAPEGERRSKRGRGAFALAQLQALDKVLLTRVQMDCVLAMRDAVYANREAARLLEISGVVEHSLCWTHESSGVRCKARFDKVLTTAADCIVDLKTTESAAPDVWPQRALRYGYHHQAAFYRMGWEAVMDRTPAQVYFIVVGKQPPYQTVVYQACHDLLNAAHRNNERMLADLGYRREHDAWDSEHNLGGCRFDTQLDTVVWPVGYFASGFAPIETLHGPKLWE